VVGQVRVADDPPVRPSRVRTGRSAGGPCPYRASAGSLTPAGTSRGRTARAGMRPPARG